MIFYILLSGKRCVHLHNIQLIVFNIQFLFFDIIQSFVFTARKRSKGTKREDGKNQEAQRRKVCKDVILTVFSQTFNQNLYLNFNKNKISRYQGHPLNSYSEKFFARASFYRRI